MKLAFTRALFLLIAFLPACGDGGGNGNSSSRAREYVFVANEGSDLVSVVDVQSGATVKTIPVGEQPRGIAIQDDGARAYVTNARDITVIDSFNDAVVGSFVMPRAGQQFVFPDAVLPAREGTTLYVTGRHYYGSGYHIGSTLTAVDRSNLSVITTTIVDGCYTVVALAPDGRTLYAVSGHTCEFGTGIRPATVSALAADTLMPTHSANLPQPLPTSVATSPDGTRLYVVSSDFDADASVVILDAATLEVTTRIPIDKAVEIVLAPDGRRAYVRTATGVAVLDLTTLSVSATIRTGDAPTGLTISDDGQRLYVTDLASYSLSIIDAATNSVSATLPVRSRPFGPAAIMLDRAVPTPVPSPTAGASQLCAYVTRDVDRVAIVNSDPLGVTGDIPVSGRQIVLAPGGAFAYVPRWEWSDVAIIDTRTRSSVAEIPLAGQPRLLALSPDGRFAYAPITQRGIAVIDLERRTVATTISTDGYIFAVVLANTGLAYATTQVCSGEGGATCHIEVLVIDTAVHSIVRSIDVGNWTTDDIIAISPDGSRLYGVDVNGKAVLILDTAQGKIVGSVPLDNGLGLALHPDGKTIYALGQQLTVIDLTSGVVVATLPLSGESMAFTPDGAHAYLSGWRTDSAGANVGTIFVIDTRSNSVEDELPTTVMPFGIAIGNVVGGCTDSANL